MLLMQVTVQYHADDVDTFIQLADLIEDSFPNVVVEGDDSSGTQGSFAIVDADGKMLHSLAVEDLEDEDPIIKVLDKAGYHSS